MSREESIVHLICTIPGSLEEVSALLRQEEIAGLGGRLEEGVEGAGFATSQMCFEFRMRHFDRIQVGRVRRQKEQAVFLQLQKLLRVGRFVRQEVVHCPASDLHGKSAERGAVKHPGRTQFVDPPACDEGLRAPVTKGSVGRKAHPRHPVMSSFVPRGADPFA